MKNVGQLSGGVHKIHKAGTHRIASPADTLARVQALMGKMGITRVANVTGLDRVGLPVVVVCRPNSRSNAVAQGKGLDLESAKVSGLMEAVETFHAERIALPLRLGRYSELREELLLIDVDGLPLSTEQPFDLEEQRLWMEARDFLADTNVWVPYELVHTDYTVESMASGKLLISTNGLASGNHLLEAVSHGICEVVERDATTLWRRSVAAHRTATGLDPHSIDDPACQKLLEHFDAAGVEVKIWDVTSDVGIASFYCMTADRADVEAKGRTRLTGDGAGCHPSCSIALARALTEAAQVRLTYIAGSREDIRPEEFSGDARGLRLRICQSLMKQHEPNRRYTDVPTFESASLERDITWELERLASAGFKQVAVVDLSTRDIDLSVARVVIPGLEGPDEHPGYMPGRRALADRGNP